MRDSDAPETQRVQFDNSVAVMQSVTGSYGQPGTSGSCPTVKAEIQPNDPQAIGIVNPAQRALIRLTNPNAVKLFYGYQDSTSLLPKYGEALWYGFAFATNSEYRPHYDPSFGAWNNIFVWHNSIYPNPTGSNLSIGVTTIGPSSGASRWSCGSSLSQLSKPRIMIGLDGGNVGAGGSDSTQSTCKRYLGPEFQAGQRYRISMRIKWNAYQNGEVEVWINDVRYVNEIGISTWWRNGDLLDNVYPILENYRKYDTSLPTNIVYYGGIVKGSTAADVAIP